VKTSSTVDYGRLD